MNELILGESVRTMDDRYRISLPAEFADQISTTSTDCMLTKEHPGCLGLWSSVRHHERHEQNLEFVTRRIETGRLETRLEQVQQLGRLLSTRQVPVKLAGRGRIVVPEGFREFLGVEPGESVMIVGAAVCVELWHPKSWTEYVAAQIPKFRQLLEELAGETAPA